MQPQKITQCNQILPPNQLYQGSHQLFLGGKGALRPEFIEMFNIQSIVSIMDKDLYDKTQIRSHVDKATIKQSRYLWIDLQDEEYVDITKHFDEVHNFIDKNINAVNVLIHCMAGVSRSASFVIGYIMKHKKMDYLTAKKYVIQRRNQVSPNQGFEAALRQFQKSLYLFDPPTQFIEQKYKTKFCDHIISLKNPSRLETHNLFLGQATAVKNQYLSNLKIHSVLSILTENECQQLKIREVCANLNINHKVIHAEDNPESNLKKHLQTSIQFIEAALECGNVLVHCRQGKSRSATIVIGFLMRKIGLDYENAFNFAKKKRQRVQPNPGFINQLKSHSLK